MKKHHKLLKNLMLGLIYPAVLGNIIYLCIDKIVSQTKLIPFWTSGTTDWVLTLKFLFLFVTLAFYFSDYLYIEFTNIFRKIFFVFDIIFVIALLVTVVNININNDVNAPNKPPNIFVIATCYLVFMILYLLWDILELRQLSKSNNSYKEILDGLRQKSVPGEIGLYRKIVRWEILSIILLLIWIILFCIYGAQLLTSWSLLGILIYITVRFWTYTLQKKEFSKST